MLKFDRLLDVSSLCRYEKTTAALAYLALICLVFAQVVFFSKSLMPLLFYPSSRAAVRRSPEYPRTRTTSTSPRPRTTRLRSIASSD